MYYLGYTYFQDLFNKVPNSESIEQYIHDNNQGSWTKTIYEGRIEETLRDIYDVYFVDTRDIVDKLDYVSLLHIAKKTSIPYLTLEKWMQGKEELSEIHNCLFKYMYFMNQINDRDKLTGGYIDK